MKLNELYEILLGKEPSTNILLNEEEIFKLIPELEQCKGFYQNSEWHRLNGEDVDVYDHILLVVDLVKPILPLSLAALFHDIGKPLCYSEDSKGNGHFPNHWTESKRIFEEFALRNNIDKNTSSIVSKLINYHDLRLENLKSSELKELSTKFTEEEIKLLFMLKEADLLAQNAKFRNRIHLLNEQEEQMLKLRRKEGSK